jgi:hypothetical protein
MPREQDLTEGRLAAARLGSEEALVQVLAMCRHRVNGVAFAPDGQTLASVSHGGAVKLWFAARERPNR